MSTFSIEQLSCHPFTVGEVMIRPQSNEVEQQGQVIRVERQVMLVLVHLAAHVDQAVTRESLLDTLWADSYSGDEALTQAVSKLRRALGGGTPSPIQTIRKVGYRLKGPVCLVKDRIDHLSVSVAPRPRRRTWPYMTAAMVILVVFLPFRISVFQSAGEPYSHHMVRVVIPDEGSIRFEKATIEMARTGMPLADSLVNFEPLLGTTSK